MDFQHHPAHHRHGATKRTEADEISRHRRCRFHRFAYCQRLARAGRICSCAGQLLHRAERENIEALTSQFGRERLEILEGDVRDASRVGGGCARRRSHFPRSGFCLSPPIDGGTAGMFRCQPDRHIACCSKRRARQASDAR
ncbi:MAG: hypothetical protein MZV64_24190 [Ignavibacteriales bacterium]|nr:hypothetical protein [Ignavibacteriales bacterium]